MLGFAKTVTQSQQILRYAMSIILKTLGAVVAIAMLPQLAHAEEYNQRPHMDPSLNAKVSRAIAKSWQRHKKGRGSIGSDRTSDGCGDQIVGDFSGTNRRPREVIIVARDIIQINQNCRR
jgi:hypothetical protein